MSFNATKREWSELYAFLRLLSDGFVYEGVPDLSCDGLRRIPVARIRREEHDGTRDYVIEGDDIRIVGEGINKTLPRADFGEAASRILEALRQTHDEEVESPDGVEGFLDEISLYDLEANTEDRTDFAVSFYGKDVPCRGFIVRSRLGRMFPLLDGGRTANLKYELVGVKLPSPAVNKVNNFGEEEDVLGRILMLERLGCTLKFADVADKIFRHNLCMIDLRFPRLIGEMVRVMFIDNVVKMDELTQLVEAANPHKIKGEMVEVNGYYRYKVREFLLDIVTGMRPTKPFKGRDSAIKGLLLVDADGKVLCYDIDRRDVFADFLFANTRLEKGSTKKDKYGYVERENGTYHMKLNLKVGLQRR